MNQRIVLRETHLAQLEVLLDLQPHQEIPLDWHAPDVPLPDTFNPFARPPLRKLADIVADYYKPAAAEAAALKAADERTAEQKETDEQYKRVGQQWCEDCEVLTRQLKELEKHVDSTTGRPTKGMCYQCVCKLLGIQEKQADGAADSQDVDEQDSVAAGRLNESKQAR